MLNKETNTTTIILYSVTKVTGMREQKTKAQVKKTATTVR